MSAADLAGLRAAAETYAWGADRRDKAAWRAVMTDDVEIVGPGFAITGLEANLGSIDHLAHAFVATRHVVHDIDAVIDGDTARGETRSTAEHRIAGTDGTDTLLVWAIRYQDTWRRDGAEWRFARRELVVDWEELRTVRNVGGGA
ncbi:nuclear transport factor 2 family protein [Novosphingobium sp.]|uniref:nuclear transport factor 2 family protein n=1 Tax=Novosphingobium sp. TaxID=1874826 RepID=UPI003340084F